MEIDLESEGVEVYANVGIMVVEDPGEYSIPAGVKYEKDIPSLDYTVREDPERDQDIKMRVEEGETLYLDADALLEGSDVEHRDSRDPMEDLRSQRPNSSGPKRSSEQSEHPFL